jgi:hypothetical protein
MGLRRESRELALQMLYALDTLKGDLRETLRGFREGVEPVNGHGNLPKHWCRGCSSTAK